MSACGNRLGFDLALLVSGVSEESSSQSSPKEFQKCLVESGRVAIVWVLIALLLDVAMVSLRCDAGAASHDRASSLGAEPLWENAETRWTCATRSWEGS